MEYEHYLKLIASHTTFDAGAINNETSTRFLKWMKNTPDLAYQYATMIVSNMPPPRFKAYEDSNF